LLIGTLNLFDVPYGVRRLDAAFDDEARLVTVPVNLPCSNA
jgi:hypothetical protein